MVSTGTAAAHLGVKRQTVRSWIDQGRLEAVRLPSGVYRIRWSSVQELLKRLDRE